MSYWNEKQTSSVGLTSLAFSTSTAGNVAPQTNYLFNGNFEGATRGASGILLNASSATRYRLNRWGAMNNQASFCSRQSWTSGGTHPGNSQFVMRCGGDATTSMRMQIAQGLESNIVIGSLRGKYLTYSGWIRFAGATVTGSPGVFRIRLGYTTATANQTMFDHDYLATASGEVNYTNGSLPTTWTRFSVGFTIPTTANNVAVDNQFTNNVTFGTGDYYELSQTILSEGADLPPFTYQGGSFNEDLITSQRYCEPVGSGLFGQWTATTDVKLAFSYRILKRTSANLFLLTTTPVVEEIGVADRTGTASAITGGTPTEGSGGVVTINGFTLATPGNRAATRNDNIFYADSEL